MKTGLDLQSASRRVRVRWMAIVPLLAIGVPTILLAGWLHNHGRSFAQTVTSTFQRQQLFTARGMANNAEEVFAEVVTRLGQHRSDVLEMIDLSRWTPEGQRQLDRFLETHRNLVDRIAIVNAEGDRIIHSPRPSMLIGVADRPEFLAARSSGRPSISGATTSPYDRMHRVVRVFVPIGSGSDFAGGLTAPISLERFWDRCLVRLPTGSMGNCWVVNASGEILFHSDYRYVDGTWSETRFEPTPGATMEKICSNVAPDGIWRRVKRGEEGVAQFTAPADGIKYLMAFSPIRLGDHLYGLAIATPRSEIAGPLSAHTRLTYGLLAGLVLFCGLAGYMTYRGSRAQMRLEEEHLHVEERRQAAERTEHLNAVLLAIRDIGQLSSRATDRDAMLQRSCQALVESRGYHHAWIALLNNSGEVVTSAQAGLGRSFVPLFDRLKRGELPHCSRRTLSRAGVHAIRDPSTTCSDCPLAHCYAGRGAMAVRLEHGGDIYGLFCVSLSAGLIRDAEERSLFQALAGDIANALHKLELERLRIISAEALARSESEYRSLFENMSVGLAYHRIIVDQNGEPTDYEFLQANPAFESLIGLKATDIIGRKVTEVIPGIQHSNPDFIPTCGGVALEGKPITFDSYFDPVKRWLSVTVYSPRYRHFVTIVQDITDRKRVESELEAAKEAAEGASRAKGNFLANMSHEIRTPMNGVLGMADILLETDLSAEQRRHVETILRSGQALLGIINDILDFSKIEADKLTIESIPFDMGMIVEDVAELLAGRAQEKGLELVVHQSPDAPNQFIGDPGRIRQVLTNLANNAIKFTHEGHVIIRVVCEETTAAGATMRLSVEDSGIGIPEDQIEHVFDEFAQAEASTTRKYGGTGLGLTISRKLVELMGGRICATSREGQGSAFSFTLRLQLDTEAAPPRPSTIELNGVRVLVIADLEEKCRALEDQLSSWGMRAKSCILDKDPLAILHNAKSAGDPYSMALFDCNFGEMSAELLGHVIKINPALRETVLLMLTSAGFKGDAKRFAEAGFAAYLVRPLRHAELMDALTEVWNQRDRDEQIGLVTRHTLAELRGARGIVSEEPAQAGDTPIEQPAKAARWSTRSDEPGTGHGTAAAAPPDQPIRACILVAEDDPVNQSVAQLILEKIGCQVDLAANGWQTLEMHEKRPYDLIFMDCNMPEMDGFEATRQIRSREAPSRRTPIIALTASAMATDRDRCLEVGMDDVVVKPVNQERLREALERWLPAAGQTDRQKTA